jgi:hypothetical protein
MPVALDTEQRTAIMEHIYRYTRACDFGATVEEFMQDIFTSDIVLDGSLMGTYDGEDGIRKWVAGCNETQSRLTMLHVVSNEIIEPTPEGARVSTYLTELMIYPPQVVGRTDHVTDLAFSGLYTFELRQQDNGWRISKRTVRVLRHDPETLPRFDA